MDIHIDKKVAGLLVIVFVIGGIIGGAIGFMASQEDGGGREGHMMMGVRGEKMGWDMFDNHADGETNDDKGGLPNSDEKPIINTPAQNTNATSNTTPTTQ